MHYISVYVHGTAQVGTTLLVVDYGSETASYMLSVEDTFLPGWPRASAASDTSVELSANMTTDFSVTYLLLPSASVDWAQPPSASSVEQRE